jgi:hypothetical protein
MSELDSSDLPQPAGQPGQTRTWWHPLFARLLEHVLASGYHVFEEVMVGKLPLRVDFLLIRREDGTLSAAASRDLDVLLPLLNRHTLVQFKGPTDALQQGDAALLFAYAFLWHGQQPQLIWHDDMSLIVLAPKVNEAIREEFRFLGCEIKEHEAGILRVIGMPFKTWLMETDVMAERGQPVLSLVSRVFLRDGERIIQLLTQTGHLALLHYALQQVQQFRKLGKDFAMQHKDSEYLGRVDEEWQTALLEAIPPERFVRRLTEDPDEELQRSVLEAIPPEKRLRGLPPEERLRGLPPEERLRGLSPEDLVDGLSEEQAARLRELLERRQGK